MMMVNFHWQTVLRLSAMTLCLIAAGCADQHSRTEPFSRVQGTSRVQDVYQNRSPEVVRYDRYTLASTRPADAQRDPLNQIIDIRMPVQVVNTIGEGLRYVLLGSGYSLCAGDPGVYPALFTKPLPAVQRSVGPVKLSEALQILAGPAWRMRVDDLNREICFVLRDEYRHLAPAASQTPVVKGNAGAASSAGSLLTRNTPPAVSGGSSSFPLPPARPDSAGTQSASVPAAAPAVQATTAAAVAAKAPRNPFSGGQSAPAQPSTVPSSSAPAKPSTALPPAPAPSSLSATSAPLNKAALGVPPAGVKTVSAAVPASAPLTKPSAPAAAAPVFTPGTPVMTPSEGQAWRAVTGITLKETLKTWASGVRCESGSSPYWTVIWPTPLNYRIDAPLVLHGNFESVVVQLFELYKGAQKPLYATANRYQCLVFVSDTPPSPQQGVR
ncbi:PFGI-1 class ICE element type IV pilus protein PilL2 [Citrobacter sedlakii]|uniref:PFGI-1 class ICE element type IV pilus protein PilL2 n=1 Tax=Citrobacter sedlakii TaxID=67826 RepID=UPI0020BFA493|nr:TcpQ domain-containing protein [Citrobacter sedlakii]MCK8147086.1 TcpQ domain-containing protein [Citrobacter sedlakii]